MVISLSVSFGRITLEVKVEVATVPDPAKIAVPTCVAPSHNVTWFPTKSALVEEALDVSWSLIFWRLNSSFVARRLRTPSVTPVEPAETIVWEGLDPLVTVNDPVAMVINWPADPVTVSATSAPVVTPVTVIATLAVIPHVMVSLSDTLVAILHLSANVFTVPFETVRVLSKLNALSVASVKVLTTFDPVLRAVAPSKSWQFVTSDAVMVVTSGKSEIDENRTSSPDAVASSW